MTIVFAELIHLPLDHAANRLGQFALEIRHSPDQLPTVVVLNDHAAVAKVAEQIDHEERIAFGSAVKNGRELFRKLVSGKRQREVAVDVVWAQERQWDLSADAPPLEFQLNRTKGVLAPQEVRRAVGKQDQHAQFRALAPEVSQ